MSVHPGRTLDQYRLTEKIGEGGMGQVWRAVDTGLDREVAIKILPDGFGDDGESIFIGERGRAPLPIERYWIDSGKREKIWEFMPAEPAGLIDIGPVALTPDGRSYLYSYRQRLSTLYVIDGL